MAACPAQQLAAAPPTQWSVVIVMTKTLLLIVVTGSVGGDGGVTGQCHQICQHHDNVPSLTTSAAPPVIRHKAGRYWALELAWQ